MKITYFLEVFSSWCHWAEPTWAELKRRYEGRAQFEWKIALMRAEDFPASEEQCRWFYRRSGTIVRSPYMLNSGWYDASYRGRYDTGNLVAQGAKRLGIPDDRVRLALTQAALRDGKRVNDLDTAVAFAAAASGLDEKAIRSSAQSPDTLRAVQESTEEFHRHQITQRPAFVLQDAIGDKAVFSGLVKLEPLTATIDAMLGDTAAYATHEAHFGRPPAA